MGYCDIDACLERASTGEDVMSSKSSNLEVQVEQGVPTSWQVSRGWIERADELHTKRIMAGA